MAETFAPEPIGPTLGFLASQKTFVIVLIGFCLTTYTNYATAGSQPLEFLPQVGVKKDVVDRGPVPIAEPDQGELDDMRVLRDDAGVRFALRCGGDGDAVLFVPPDVLPDVYQPAIQESIGGLQPQLAAPLGEGSGQRPIPQDCVCSSPLPDVLERLYHQAIFVVREVRGPLDELGRLPSPQGFSGCFK